MVILDGHPELVRLSLTEEEIRQRLHDRLIKRKRQSFDTSFLDKISTLLFLFRK